MYNTNDKHISVIKTLCARITEKYPDCSIGISGSVAKHEHMPSSDIDLLVISNSFIKNRQHVFILEGIPDINILCLSPKQIDERYNQWSMSFNGQHLNYISSSNVIYDPSCYLKNMINRIAITKQNIMNHDSIYIKSFKEYFNANINNVQVYNDKVNNLNKLKLVICAWFIYKGIILNNKQDHNNSFNIIMNKDKVFYDMLIAALENFNKENLQKMIEYISQLNYGAFV